MASPRTSWTASASGMRSVRRRQSCHSPSARWVSRAPARLASTGGKRQKAGEQTTTKLVSIDEADVVEGGAKGGAAQISVRFSTKMTTATRDSAGAVIHGDPDLVISTDDLWTFAREIGSSDPTWRLVATESDHKH